MTVWESLQRRMERTQVAVKVITLPPEMVNMKCENIKELKTAGNYL